MRGSGCFADSGDVPGAPILRFGLHGDLFPAAPPAAGDEEHRASSAGAQEGDEELGWAAFTKTYETSPHTAGYVVAYAGHLTRTKRGEHWLRGTWRNLKDGGFGPFFCRKEARLSGETMQLVICDSCGAAIEPGVLRWSCDRCTGAFSVCSGCHDVGARLDGSALHPGCEGSLVDECVHVTQRVDGASCAALIATAFEAFGPRPFVGLRGAEGKGDFEWLSYAATKLRAQHFAAALPPARCFAGQASPTRFLLLVGRTSPEYFIALLGCLWSDALGC